MNQNITYFPAATIDHRQPSNTNNSTQFHNNSNAEFHPTSASNFQQTSSAATTPFYTNNNNTVTSFVTNSVGFF